MRTVTLRFSHVMGLGSIGPNAFDSKLMHAIV